MPGGMPDQYAEGDMTRATRQPDEMTDQWAEGTSRSPTIPHGERADQYAEGEITGATIPEGRASQTNAAVHRTEPDPAAGTEPAAPDPAAKYAAGACGGWCECGLACCRRFRCLIIVLCVVAFLGAAIEGGVQTATLTAQEDEFGLTTTQLGAIIASYDIAAVVASLPTAWLLARNIPVSIGAGVLLACASSVGYGLGSSFAMFFTMRFIYGLGFTPMWTLGFVHIDNNVPDQQKAVAFHSRPMAFAVPGWIVGAAIAAVFMMAEGNDTPGACEARDEDKEDWCASAPTITPTRKVYAGCDSWRYGYFLLPLVLAPFAVWFMQSRKLFPDYSPKGPQKQVSGNQIAELKDSVRAVACNPRWVLVSLGSAASAFGQTATVGFSLRYIERQLCVERGNAVFLVAGFIPIVMASMIVGGLIPKCLKLGVGGQLLQMVFSNVTAIPFMFGFMSRTVVGFFCPIAVGLFLQYLSPPASVNVLQRCVREEHKEYSVTLNNFPTRILGTITGPIAFGAMLDHEALKPMWVNYTVVGAVSSFVSGALWFAAWRLHVHGVREGWEGYEDAEADADGAGEEGAGKDDAGAAYCPAAVGPSPGANWRRDSQPDGPGGPGGETEPHFQMGTTA